MGDGRRHLLCCRDRFGDLNRWITRTTRAQLVGPASWLRGLTAKLQSSIFLGLADFGEHFVNPTISA